MLIFNDNESFSDFVDRFYKLNHEARKTLLGLKVMISYPHLDHSSHYEIAEIKDFYTGETFIQFAFLENPEDESIPW